MTWDDDAACWQVDVRDTSETATGQTERIRAHAVIAALGILRVAKFPDINGRESFQGPTLHSTTWDQTIDLVGKRVGVIGTGASANQIVPALAPDVAQLTVYQRSAHWILSHPKYGKKLEGVVEERRCDHAAGAGRRGRCSRSTSNPRSVIDLI